MKSITEELIVPNDNYVKECEKKREQYIKGLEEAVFYPSNIAVKVKNKKQSTHEECA